MSHARNMERVAGNDPASSVWKTEALPLDDTRLEPNYSVVKEPETLVGDLGLEPRISCSQGKRVKPFPKSP